MKPAELKTLRERLGLSTEWVARAAGVRDRRSVRYWESGTISPRRGKVSVPADVAKMLTELDDQLWEIAQQSVDQTVKLARRKGAPAEIVLYRYRDEESLWEAHPDMGAARLPVSTHAVILSRSQWLLKQAGFDAVIDYVPE